MPSQTNQLSARLEIIARMTTLCAVRRRQEAFLLIKHFLRNKRCSPRFFKELLIHLSLFFGYPLLLEGMEQITTVSRTPRTPRRWKSRSQEGRHVFGLVYGEQAGKVLAKLEALEPGLSKHIVEHAYGTIMARPGLTLAEREIINIVALFVEGYEPQLFSHIRGALLVGVKPSVIQSVLSLSGSIASRRSKRAEVIVRHVAGGLKKSLF
ncbi:MAG TPA: carboxymuconolactone decarboxylase family protein [Bacteroidota bacterium]|nr:carboxymuconolactone decarboxylase family protein [Bacteroidota bacterium]